MKNSYMKTRYLCGKANCCFYIILGKENKQKPQLLNQHGLWIWR
ncbi:hypothetical protein L798_07110 [Zootermopsis nevadensis]|uniref:Uncharacterized protein n=1 Tax=Zootermopsis nevadensis TaxID=136037 RepID=A0A067RTN7_ZOONE|nr:hypothetical protein L798_07110 [Zootermopsis nevadensis]